MTTTHAVAWTDGSNGPSKSKYGAASYVIALKENREIIEERAEQFLHEPMKFTSNDMEMTAVLLCLEAAKRLEITDLEIRSDSQWTVNIISGEFTLRDRKFVSIVEEIRDLGLSFRSVSLKHVSRDRNSRADWLCRKATNQQNRVLIPQLSW